MHSQMISNLPLAVTVSLHRLLENVSWGSHPYRIGVRLAYMHFFFDHLSFFWDKHTCQQVEGLRSEVGGNPLLIAPHGFQRNSRIGTR